MPEIKETLVKATIESLQIKPVSEEFFSDPKLDLDTLTLMITLRREKELLAKSKGHLEEIQEKNKRIVAVNNATQSINAFESGAIDLTNKHEVIETLRKAQEAGATINLDKMKYTVEERNRLLENLSKTTESLNLQTQTDMQAANLLPQINDSWAAATRLLKTLHDAKMAPTKRLAG